MADLEKALAQYGIRGKIIGTSIGPVVTQIKFRPQSGTKIKSIISALPDISRESGYKSLKISNYCDNDCIGFEIPNSKPQIVELNKILQSDRFKKFDGVLPIILGVNIEGDAVFADLSKMPHLLAAGATGSGKSVELNAFIISLITRKTPAEVKFILIDPKRIEFSVYNNQEYLYMPVITDNFAAAEALAAVIAEMNRRYQLFEGSGAKNLSSFNETAKAKLPYIVLVIDEFSDLVLTDKRVEKQIQILAQKARAAGIHLILATQRPSVDVVTGSIKANFPARLAFKTASGIDSKTILDTTGAETLIGRGDALYLAPNGQMIRIQGAYISDKEIAAILMPYRSKVTMPPLTASNQINSESAAQKPKTIDNSSSKKPFFLFTWLVALWKYLGKRDQKKLLKMIFDTLFGKQSKKH